jgi:hypothetical protein
MPESSWKHAAKSTWPPGVRSRIIKETITFAVGSILFWLGFRDREALMGEIAIFATFVVGATVIVEVGHYLWNFVRAPYRQRNEARQQITTLETVEDDEASKAAGTLSQTEHSYHWFTHDEGQEIPPETITDLELFVSLANRLGRGAKEHELVGQIAMLTGGGSDVSKKGDRIIGGFITSGVVRTEAHENRGRPAFGGMGVAYRDIDHGGGQYITVTYNTYHLTELGREVYQRHQDLLHEPVMEIEDMRTGD